MAKQLMKGNEAIGEAAIQAGFTAVMMDRSSCPDEKNIADVSQVVELAHMVGVSVEAELGHVGMANNYDVDRNAALTSPSAAASVPQMIPDWSTPAISSSTTPRWPS